MMTSRERLTRLFDGEDIDRVPIWLLFPYFPSPSYADIWHNPSYRPVLQRVYDCTDIIERRHFDVGFCFNRHPDIHCEHREAVEDGNTLSERIVRHGDVVLRSSVTRGAGRSSVVPFVEDIGDLDRLLAMPFGPAKPAVDGFLEEEDEFGDRGLMAVDLGDPLSVLHGLCSGTDFVLWCYEETAKATEFLDVIAARARATYRYLLERGIGDVYWISGSEFACPPMLSPELFDRFVVGYTKPLVDLVHGYGKKTMIHCHGRINEVLGGLAGIGASSHHPLEAPPMGNCTLTQVRQALGPEPILAGNFQLGDLWSLTEEETDDLVRRTVQEGKQGPFIFAMTGGPSAPRIDEQVAGNYLKIIETATDVGRY